MSSNCNSWWHSQVLILHHISQAHLACVEAKQNKELYEANDTQHHPWLNVIVKMNKQLLQHMNQVILDVYNDAKIGTLSAWSWPSWFHTVFCWANQCIWGIWAIPTKSKRHAICKPSATQRNFAIAGRVLKKTFVTN